MSTDNPSDGQDRTAELLSQALHEEADMVNPDPGALQAIQQRTTPSRSPRRSWVYAGVGTAAATAAVIAGVVIIGDSNDPSSTGPASGGPTQAQQTDQPVTEPVTPVLAMTYLGAAENGYRLQTEMQIVDDATDTDPELLAVRYFLTEQPADPDYQTGWPNDLDVGGIAASNNSIQVDLTGPEGGLEAVDPSLPPQAQMLALQALFRTADGQPGDSATLTYNGDPVQSAFGVQLPTTVKSDDDVRAFISIDDLTDGQSIKNRRVSLTVSGNVFEGNVNWQLLDSSGAKVDEGFVTTSMGEWTPARIELGELDSGSYTVRCLEFSPEDGKPGNVDDKTFTVE